MYRVHHLYLSIGFNEYLSYRKQSVWTSDERTAFALFFWTAIGSASDFLRSPFRFMNGSKTFLSLSLPLALVEHYGHYSPTQLLKVLQHGEPPVAPAPSIAKSPHTDVGGGAIEKVGSTDPIKPAPLQQCQCTDQKMPLVPRIALRAADGMTLEDAQRLVRHLKDDRRVGLCRMGLAALADGSYAVMIDDMRPFSVNSNQVISSFIDIYRNSWYNLCRTFSRPCIVLKSR